MSKVIFIPRSRIIKWKREIKKYSNKSHGNAMKNKFNNKSGN